MLAPPYLEGLVPLLVIELEWEDPGILLSEEKLLDESKGSTGDLLFKVGVFITEYLFGCGVNALLIVCL